MKGALIQGGKTQSEYRPLLNQLKPLQDQLDEKQKKWGQLWRQKQEAAKKEFGRELTYDEEKKAAAAAAQEMPPGLSISELHKEIAQAEHAFIRQHPDSYVSFDLVRSYMTGNIDAKTFESLYNSLSQRLRNRADARLWPFTFYRYRLDALNLDQLKSTYAYLESTYNNMFEAAEASEIVNMILQKINGKEATAAGKPAIPIKKVDMNGNPVNWESYKGKYLLLDFWSTHCKPCRAAHPHLKELYAKYKDKGFEILGIADEGGSSSLEHKEKLWKAAIKYDGLPWPQVLNDIDKEKFDAFKVYGTGYAKMLLDKEGKIVLRGSSEAELDKKLKEIFGY